jgi:acetoin utilization protein AcuB
MKIADLMSTKLFTVSPDDSVDEAVRLLQQRGVRHLLVLDGRDLVGIISDRDLKRALDSTKKKHKKMLNLGGTYFLLEPILVSEIMTRNPVAISANATAQEAAALMLSKKFGALPVVKAGKLVGIVTETDLLRHFVTTSTKAKKG